MIVSSWSVCSSLPPCKAARPYPCRELLARSSGRADPIAVETVRHAVAEMNKGCGTRFDVGGIEYSEIAAVCGRAPDDREQPAVALAGVGAARHEHRLRQRVPVGHQVGAFARAAAVDMSDAGESTKHGRI